jgi:hypothetical protein
MTRHWLAGAAAFAMMTGVAFAQDRDRPYEPSTTTRSTTTSRVPAVGSYKSSETRRDIDRDGDATRTKRTYHSGANGSTVTTRTRTESPVGSARTTYRERETAPDSGSTIERKIITTIVR